MSDHNDIRAALACIPADDRDLWLRIGMAVQSECPGEDGFAMFDEWSQRGETYSARAVRDTWRSFKPGKVTAGTLWHEARQRGYKGQAQPATIAEREQAQREAAARRAQQEQTTQQQAAAAAAEACRLWDAATETAPGPTYLERKGVHAFGVRFRQDGAVLIPARTAAGALVNLQTIPTVKPASGPEKRFLPRGRKSGTWHQIGQAEGAAVLLVVEGYATGASVHQATGRPVAVAWDAYNLRAVAAALHELHPAAAVLIAGDDDRETAGNPGRTRADAAARACGGAAVFPAGLPEGGTDWNDLHQSAGLDAVRAQIEAAAHAALAHDAPAEPARGRAADPDPGLANAFDVNAGGVWFTERDKDGQTRQVWVCSRLLVAARTRDADASGWGMLLEFDDPTGKPRTWAMPSRMLAGDGGEYRSVLLDMGLRIAPGPKARNLLGLYLMAVRPDEVATCTDRLGWHGSASDASFVLPRQTLQREHGDGEAAPERIVFQTDGASENPFRTRGTLQGWRDGVGALCRRNSRLTFAVSAAFGGPLLRHSGIDSGGLHFRGGSSTGKTTMLKNAASVYGGPSYMRRWRATDNALEGIAATHCDSVLILDELAQIEHKTAGQAAYLLANEQSKARSTRGGQTRPGQTWKLLFLSAGEVGLAAHMAEGGQRARAGQELRLVDIPAEVTPGTVFEDVHGRDGGAAFAMDCARAAEANFGHAGMVWLRWCVDHAPELRQRTRSGIERLAAAWVPDAASGQVHRVSHRFALVAVGGELATEAGITGWDTGEATAAAETCFRAWLDARPAGIGESENEQMMSQVRRWLQLNGAGRFTWWHRAMDDRAPDKGMRAGFRRMVTHDGKPVDKDADHLAQFGERMTSRDAEDTTTDFYVFPEVFKSEAAEGFDHHAVLRLMRNAGHLVPDKGRPFDCKPRLPGMGPTSVYRVRSTIFDSAE